jgi:hypothetical protein
MEWWQLDEEQRIKQVYTKYKLKDFWNWWSDNSNEWMEVRTIDWKIAKEIGINCNVYYSHTGVFVNNVEQLIKVIAYARDKTTIWAGANPRKWNITKYGKKGISGGDNFISTVKFIFVDIDRKTKGQPATLEELKDCNTVADKILEKMGEQHFNKSYIKICSGNGVQLLIKLDYPIKVPEVEYIKNDTTYDYIPNDEFTKVKFVVYEGIGKDMMVYINKIKNGLNLENVEVDRAGFKMSQVCALPVTKNYKYDGFRWRGIVHIENGVNVGLSDYIINRGEKETRRAYKPIFGGVKRLDVNSRLVEGKLAENPIIKLMLTDLPPGGRNNYLWFSIKCLLRDYSINLQSKEFRELHKKLEKAYGGNLTLNLPTKNYAFDERVVNRYCVNNLIPPVYKIYTERKIKFNSKIDGLSFNHLELIDGSIEFDGKNIDEDMQHLQNIMIEGDNNNITLGAKFLRGCVKKYGIDASKYYLEYLFIPFLNSRM